MHATFTHLLGPRKGECQKFDALTIPIGRAPDNGLRFLDSERRVSSHHAEITRKGDQYILRDLGSTNGTMINGRRVVVTELQQDDLLEFGAGGPLLRFGIETAPTDHLDQHVLPELTSGDGRPVGHSTVELMVDRAVRNRSSNLGIISALVVAMLIGAVAGVVVSALNPPLNGRLNVAEVADRNSRAVVFIRAEFELVDASGAVTETGAASGSGFVVSPRGFIVTNRHLVHDWENHPPPLGLAGRIAKIEVVFPGQQAEDAIPAELFRLSSDKITDIAVLKIDPPPNLAVVYGIEADLAHSEQGDEVVVIGYPLGMDLLRRSRDAMVTPSLSIGVVSRVSSDLIQLNLRAYKGESGGPLLNRKGQVIGVVTANLPSAQDIALCTPIGAAVELIKDELSYGEHQAATNGG
ncbi:MAG TPA: trypsin-like peptidase domain-containing protein [Blastocatellia bacterium]|jgi:S1-C subfamily serine protease|nr:trypsin-like peptidase domain-containing protein [Blastocatellia bacterium]